MLAAVSLSWSVAVDLTPAGERPYVDNSTSNSELQLALGYNGIQRITGQTRKFGDGATQDAGRDFRKDTVPFSGGISAEGPNGGGYVGSFSSNRGSFEKDGAQPPQNGAGRSAGGGNGMFNGGGSAGVLRMFNATLGGQDSWLLPLGLFSILALLLGTRKKSGTDGETRRKLLRNSLLWGGSVVTMVGYFSVAQFFHPYYLSAMAPFLAALVGAGLTQLWKQYRFGGIEGWLLPLSLAVTLAGQILMLRSYPSFAKILIPVACILTGIPAVLLAVFRLLRKNTAGKAAVACVALSLAGLLAAPAVWTSYSVFRNGFNASIPSAGPSAEKTGTFGQGMPSDMKDFRSDRNQDGTPGCGLSGSSANQEGEGSNTKLIEFLEKNNTGEKFLVAVPSAGEAEPIILATGKPVMAVGGFSGNDQTLTVAKLQQMVKAGTVKYFLVGGKGNMGGFSDQVTQWVEKNGKAVQASEWSSSFASGSNGNMKNGSQTLYDLSGCKSKS